jgi:hypothetical protein
VTRLAPTEVKDDRIRTMPRGVRDRRRRRRGAIDVVSSIGKYEGFHFSEIWIRFDK